MVGKQANKTAERVKQKPCKPSRTRQAGQSVKENRQAKRQGKRKGKNACRPHEYRGRKGFDVVMSEKERKAGRLAAVGLRGFCRFALCGVDMKGRDKEKAQRLAAVRRKGIVEWRCCFVV